MPVLDDVTATMALVPRWYERAHCQRDRSVLDEFRPKKIKNERVNIMSDSVRLGVKRDSTNKDLREI